MSAQSSPHRWVTNAVALGVLAAVSLLLVGLFLRAERTESALFDPVTAMPGRMTDSASQPARMAVTWSEPQVLTLFAATGRVTKIHRLTLSVPGSPVVDLDGATLRLIGGGTPLYRPVRQGMQGADVDAVYALLSQQGQATSESLSSAAIREYRRVNGFTSGSTFEPGMAIFTPDPGLDLRVEVALGDAVAGGSVIATGTPFIVAAKIVPAGSPGRVASLSRAVAAGTSMEFSSPVLPRPQVVADFELSEEERSSVPLLTSDGEPPDEIDGAIRLAVPVDVLGIPVTAVISFYEDAFCAVTMNGAEFRAAIVPIGPVSSIPGIVFVGSEFETTEFVVNPEVLQVVDPCRSG